MQFPSEMEIEGTNLQISSAIPLKHEPEVSRIPKPVRFPLLNSKVSAMARLCFIKCRANLQLVSLWAVGMWHMPPGLARFRKLRERMMVRCQKLAEQMTLHSTPGKEKEIGMSDRLQLGEGV